MDLSPSYLKDYPQEILSIILSHSDNYYCLAVCKLWYGIIIKNSVVCEGCGKVVKSYDNDLWISDTDDLVCHGYYEGRDKYRILKRMICKDSKFLTLIKRRSLGLWLCAVKYSGFPYTHVKNVPEHWYMHAMKINPFYITYQKNPTYEIYFNGVKKNGLFLQYVPEDYHTHELCLAAMQQSFRAGEYLQNHSEELWLEYIRSRGYHHTDILQYIKYPTEEICLQVFIKNGADCMKHIQYPK